MAISIGLYTRRRAAVDSAMGLPRFARDDNVGTHGRIAHDDCCYGGLVGFGLGREDG